MEKAAGYSKLIRSWNFSLFPEQAEDPCPQPVDDGWIAPRREDHPCPDDHGAVEALLVVRALDREAQAEISELAEPHDASRLQFHVEHEVEVIEHRLDIGARDRASCADHLAKGIHVRVTVVLRDGVHLGRLLRRVLTQILFFYQLVTLCHCVEN